MTLAGKLMALFPALLGLAAGACLLWLVVARDLTAIPVLLGVVYGVPPLLHRLHTWAWPLRFGGSRLADPRYNPWWGSFQIQLIYVAAPFLEAALRMVPGLYSAWLRLWGAKVGRRVVWTPQLEVTDRSLLEVGDDVIVGHRVALFGHVIRPMKDNLLLYVKPICIGDGAFIGAGSALGPGVRVGPGVTLGVRTDGLPNQEFA